MSVSSLGVSPEAEKLRIKEYEQYISWCKNCKNCKDSVRSAEPFGFTRGVCPLWKHTSGFESVIASGKLQIARGLLFNTIKPTEAMARDVYTCTTCAACQQWCASLVDTVGVIEALRADLVDAGVGPMPIHKEFAERVKEVFNPYGEPAEKRFNWLPPELKLPKKAEVVYFVGCTSAFRHQEIAKSAVELLRKSGVDFTIMPEEICCGSVFFRLGLVDVGKELAKKVMSLVDETGASTIIFSCPGCYKTFARDYPSILGKSLHYELKDVLQYLLEVDKLKFTKKLDAKVTYHDPCHLGRGLDIFEPPREFLNRIPGVKLMEMERTKRGAFCCGAGGGYRGAFPDTSLALARERVEEAVGTGSNILTSLCPFCKMNLSDAVKELNKPIQMQDITELALKAL